MESDDRLDERVASLAKEMAMLMEMDQIPTSAEDFRSRLLAGVERDQELLLERAKGTTRRGGVAHGYQLDAQVARGLRKHHAAIVAILRDAEIVADEVQRVRALKRLMECGEALQVGPGQCLAQKYPRYVDKFGRLAGAGSREAQS